MNPKKFEGMNVSRVESEKSARWKSPTIEELKERKNGFRENRGDILGLFKLLLLKRVQEGRVSFSDAKDFFQWLGLSEPSTFMYEDDMTNIAELMCPRRRGVQLSAGELERHNEAFAVYRSIPKASSADRDQDGFYLAPKVPTWSAGIYLTNMYRGSHNKGGQLMSLEDLRYRVNIACSHNISNTRILVDLFELLNKNPVLARKGFKTKSLGDNRTDAIIIYCGEEGVSAALEEAMNYCLKEGIDGSEQGVPLGIKPLNESGTKYSRVSVTSTPGEGYTFNDLQSTVLLEAFHAVVNEFLRKNGSADSFESAQSGDLMRLLPELKKRDTPWLAIAEKEYEESLKRICGTDIVNMHNLAFPFVEK